MRSVEVTPLHQAILEAVGEAGAPPEKMRLSGREFGELERAGLIVLWVSGSERPQSIYGGGMSPGWVYLTGLGAEVLGLPPSLRLA
jgi:hypothetical protein